MGDLDVNNGDIICLGPHRILCGDAYDASSLKKLTNQIKPSLIFTNLRVDNSCVRNSLDNNFIFKSYPHTRVFLWNSNLASFGPKQFTLSYKDQLCYSNFPVNDKLRDRITNNHNVSQIAENIIEYSTRINDIVLDFHLNYGLTLLSCENKQRICFAAEIDPILVKFAIRNWAESTRAKKILVNNIPRTI